MARWVVRLVTLLVLAGTAWVLHRAGDPLRTPVAAIQLEGTLQRIPRQTVARVVAEPAQIGFFRVDLEGVRVALLGLPWVKEARVWRVWPDRLRVSIRERTPAARWAGGGLVDADGVLFHPPETEYPPGLPELEGPDGTQALVLRRHGELQDWLALSGLRVRRVAMDPRRAWRVDTDRGVSLLLGREPGETAVRRVSRVLPVLLAQWGEAVDSFDLRYPNGFAVRWRPRPDASDPATGPEAKERHG